RILERRVAAPVFSTPLQSGAQPVSQALSRGAWERAELVFHRPAADPEPSNGECADSQAQGRAPPPQVAGLRCKNALVFARGTLGGAWMPRSSVFILVVHRRASTPRHETASARSSRHRMCPAAAGGGPQVQKRFGFCTRHAGRGMDAPIQRFILAPCQSSF